MLLLNCRDFLQRELTDREFEKLLEQEERDKVNKKRKRQEKRSLGDSSGVHDNSVESGEEVWVFCRFQL